jgi:hypothetical protein
VVHGIWDAYGELRYLGERERQTLLDWSLAGAYRLHRRVELGAQLAYGRQSVVAGDFASKRVGFGDTLLRVRCEVFDQPMPLLTAPPLPGVAAVVSLRVPTGALERSGTGGAEVTAGTTGSVGTTASSQSLGAWETGVGVELKRAFSAFWELTASGEIAYRFPDDSLGVERQLGPRALGSLSLRHTPMPGLSLGIATDLGWEAELELGGAERSGTAQRLWTVSAFAAWTLSPSGIRGGVLARHSPLLDEVSANALAQTSLGLSLGYSL